MMEKIKAYAPHWFYKPTIKQYEISSIPKSYHSSWTFRICKVHGHVVKQVLRNGKKYDWPVYKAKVHICEIDKWQFIIPRLPDDYLLRLRDELITLFEKPAGWKPPIPDPPPFVIDLELISFTPANIANLGKTRIKPALSGYFSKKGLGAFNPQPEPPKIVAPHILKNTVITPERSVARLSDKLKMELYSPSVDKIRKALIANTSLFHPFLCFLPRFFHRFYRSEEIATVETNYQGVFETEFLYLASGDHPDLYFWVEYCIGSEWTTVYRPPIPCHTYWDYPCGSDVTIPITDPRVPCIEDPPSVPDLQVAVLTIGNDISLNEILHPIPGVLLKDSVKTGLTAKGEPFGGSLEPHVWFGSKLIANGITHYKWSYQKISDSQGNEVTDGWHAMDKQVVRHYAVIDPAYPHSLSFKPEPMGPDLDFPAKNLMKIQPKEPPAGSDGWAPMVDARENSASSFFMTHLLDGGNALTAAGKYKLKLELFKADGVTNASNMVEFRIPTSDAPFGPGTVNTKLAGPANLITETIGGIKTVTGFSMVLHVDNNRCEAEIKDASVNDHQAGPCGFITYPAGSNVHISFRAYHPNNFANFSFTVVKGSSGYQSVPSCPIPGTALPLVSYTPVNLFDRGADSVFAKDILVNDLLQECKLVGNKGGKACFGENLGVYALANDGWSQLDYLDAYAVPKAFALEPGTSAAETPLVFLRSGSGNNCGNNCR
jgi:hypothetical protein